MKQDLNKLTAENKRRYLESFFRLKRGNKDFEVVQEFMRYCLEIRKKDLINVSVDDFQKLQGEATVLSGFFDLLELAESEGSKP